MTVNKCLLRTDWGKLLPLDDLLSHSCCTVNVTVLQVLRSAWTRVAFESFGDCHVKYRRRLCEDWRRNDKDSIRNRVLDALAAEEMAVPRRTGNEHVRDTAVCVTNEMAKMA